MLTVVTDKSFQLKIEISSLEAVKGTRVENSSERNGPVTAAFRAPLYIAWEITHRCNAKCLHCYSASGPEARFDQDLSTEEALSVIDQLADAGLMILAFSGGEPLLRKDWRTLVKHAVARDLVVNVGTNGSCITERIADELKGMRIRSVTVSLDSSRPQFHDYFRQCAGLFEKALEAIRLLVARKVRVVVGFTPTNLNWKDGPGLVELAYQLGADAVNLSEYVPAGRGSIDLALKPDELHAVLGEWIQMREAFRGKMEIIWHDCRVGLLVAEEDRRKYFGCGAGRLVARICPDGTMTPCVFLPTPIGSFRTQRFDQIWRNSLLLRQFRERNEYISGNCKSCEHLLTCGGCRAVAYAYSGGDCLAGDPHCWVQQAPTQSLSGLLEGESLPI